MAQVIPEARKPADIQRLIAIACAHPDRRYRLWTLRSWDKTEEQYVLRLVGDGMSWRRATNLDIELEPALGRKLEATWKRNKYDAFVGHRTLRSAIRELTGEDIKAKIDASQAEATAKAEATKRLNARRELARALRATLDVLQTKGNEEIISRQATRMAHLRVALDELTFDDRSVAEAVAFGTYGQPRGDD